MACNTTDSFYQSSRYEDCYVIPLCRPYKLYATSPEKEASWMFFFRNAVDSNWLYGDNIISEGGEQMVVSLVNVKNNIIIGYTESTNEYFIVIPTEKKEIKYNSRQKWLEDLDTRKISVDTLYKPFQLYQDFLDDTHNLPWYINRHN